MKCIHCGNTFDKIKLMTMFDKDGNDIGIECRFCGHRAMKKLKQKKTPVEVEDFEYRQCEIYDIRDPN